MIKWQELADRMRSGMSPAGGAGRCAADILEALAEEHSFAEDVCGEVHRSSSKKLRGIYEETHESVTVLLRPAPFKNLRHRTVVQLGRLQSPRRVTPPPHATLADLSVEIIPDRIMIEWTSDRKNIAMEMAMGRFPRR